MSNEAKLIDLALVVVNYMIQKSKTDPKIKAKIDNGEPLTLEDLKVLGVRRDAAGDELARAIQESSE